MIYRKSNKRVWIRGSFGCPLSFLYQNAISTCHCEERSDVAIRSFFLIVSLYCFQGRTDSHVGAVRLLGMTVVGGSPARWVFVSSIAAYKSSRKLKFCCHCEERSDAAIRIPLSRFQRRTDSHVGAARLLGMTVVGGSTVLRASSERRWCAEAWRASSE